MEYMIIALHESYNNENNIQKNKKIKKITNYVIENLKI